MNSCIFTILCFTLRLPLDSLRSGARSTRSGAWPLGGSWPRTLCLELRTWISELNETNLNKMKNESYNYLNLTLGFCSHYSKKWVMGGKDADRQRRVAEYTGRERGVDLLHKKRAFERCRFHSPIWWFWPVGLKRVCRAQFSSVEEHRVGAVWWCV